MRGDLKRNVGRYLAGLAFWVLVAVLTPVELFRKRQ